MSKLESIRQSDLKDYQNYVKMKGGHFYKYSACRINKNIIYDIENIRHEQIFAQTPLNMNDPFDSLFGVDEYAFINDIVEVLRNLPEFVPYAETIVLIQNLFLGNEGAVKDKIDAIWVYLSTIRRNYKIKTTSVKEFVDIVDFNYLYKHAPKKLKSLYPNIQLKLVFDLISNVYSDGKINQFELKKLLNDKSCDFTLLSKIKDGIGKHEYADKIIKEFKVFLSKVTVSCFCETGWQNQLMWSHYAGAYAGICVEYDFSDYPFGEDVIFKKVHYSKTRPVFNVFEHGKIVVNGEGEISFDINDDSVNSYEETINYLTSKSDCWNYENEWRMISVGECNVPKLIDVKNRIVSITFGLYVEERTKALLVAICKIKNIVCYDLVIDPLSYDLHRKIIDIDAEACNIVKILNYLNILSDDIRERGDIYKSNVNRFVEEADKLIFNNEVYILTIQNITDLISNIYLAKLAVKQIETVDKGIYSEVIYSVEYARAVQEWDSFIKVIRVGIIGNNNKLMTLVKHGVINEKEYKKIMLNWESVKEICNFIDDLSIE